MGQNTAIEWCDHTFNPWWGCTRISAGCQNCYAEKLAKRLGKAEWGNDAERVVASTKVWNDPIRWQRMAQRYNRRYRVFCSSMADVFEDRRDLDQHRARLWELIAATPRLDWLLLTKRPGCINKLIPQSWARDSLPRNVGVGTTIEMLGQGERLEQLCSVTAHMRFVSCEPLLTMVALGLEGMLPKTVETSYMHASVADHIHWVIVGGESGSGARPMHPDWVRSIRAECERASVPFFFKQWGAWQPVRWPHATHAVRLDGQIRKVSDWAPSMRAGFEPPPGGWQGIVRAGKKHAGCLLDGVETKQIPKQTSLFAA
jgi:protein gp37